ncbi:hypothetical protein PMAYCL1PPCAC_14992, partial [Pristionchus mayeri]
EAMAQLIGNNTPALKKGDLEPHLAPGRARIYSMRFCPFAERALLYAAAKGIEVEIVNINLTEKPEWYFAKHPQGKVPAFEKDGKVVIESEIVPEYLDGIYPESAILPSDPFLRAKQRIILEQASAIQPAFHGLLVAYRDNLEGEAKAAKVKAVEEALGTVEKLLEGKYFGGSAPGFADWMLFPFFERIATISPVFPLPSPFPSPRWSSLSSWWTRISPLPAAAVMQPKENQLAFIKSFVGGTPDYDVGI